jgi:hypothetical protein
MRNGIMIIASKHPYYGRMAYNLAATIKASEQDCPVCIVHAGRGLSHLTDLQKAIFDEVIEIPENDYGVGVKLYAYEHTPFDGTLLIDADNLWFKRKPSELFAELEPHEFSAITEGFIDFETGENNLRTDYFMWANVDAMKMKFDMKGKMYQFRSEIMWFRKTERVGCMFKTAKEIFHKPEVEVVRFGGVVPDEYAINIACNLCGVVPHVYKWQPCYWDRIHKLQVRDRRPGQLFDKYWLMSTGGNGVTSYCTRLYNQLASAACYKLGVQFLFTLQPKKRVIEERKLM